MDGGGLFYCDATNTICYGNTGLMSGDYKMGSFAYSCTSPLPAGEGNVSADPLFADADNGDFRLLAASPCRDKGSNSYAAEPTDLAGSPRILSGTVDMGARMSSRGRSASPSTRAAGA